MATTASATDRRISTLHSHLTSSSANAGVTAIDNDIIAKRMKDAMELMKQLEDKTTKLDLTKLLPGPLDKMSKAQVQLEVATAFMYGGNMLMVEQWCKEYGGSPAANIVFPLTITPMGEMPYIDWMVTLANPDDVVRVLRNHTRKSHMYGVAFLGEGVLSTRDRDLWIHQRRHLAESFLPDATLSKEVFPVSLARAKFAAEELMTQHATRGIPFDVNEFLLNETMAQLQLALFGETDSQMNATNKHLRGEFDKVLLPHPDLKEGMRLRTEARREIHKWANGVLDRKPSGPLGRRFVDNCPMGQDLPKVRRDTVATFGFAGFDTTGNMLTWALYELCKLPHLQLRAQAEADALFSQLTSQGREFQFHDLQSLPFISRVLTETLRLFPSVPNGTFRELETDQVIEGRNGTKVTLPAGTQINIPVWLLHTNPQLWGPDVEEFNPDREFLPDEIWNGKALGFVNPASHRYMPFTGPPRDCIGKNFANVEARLILVHLLHRYNFVLAEPTLSRSKTDRVREFTKFIASNNGTMGPKGGLWVIASRRV